MIMQIFTHELENPSKAVRPDKHHFSLLICIRIFTHGTFSYSNFFAGLFFILM